ncbi:MAG: type IX secretion system membrane protein PorP/SprF [Muribaculaceae bacterium]|nr:type IX secretion system membrane protein PorP/SprF [Muribaculaceae bacterium]
MTNMKTRLRVENILAAILLAGCFLVGGLTARAQSDAQFSQYFEVPNYYNAAAIGTTDLLKIRGGARLQWVGIQGAPKTFVVAADMPFVLLKKRFGVGLVMQQESMGLYKNLNLGAQVAYKQKLFKGTLSIGAQLGFVDQSFKGTEVYIPDQDDYHQPNDDAIPKQDIRGNAFDVSAGLFYSHPKFWLGVSGTHLNAPSVSLNADSGENSEEKNYEFQIGRTLYFMAGSNIKVKNTLFEVMPSALVKTDFTFTTWEATLRGRYNKFLTFGVGYRWKDAVYAVLSAELKGFYIGFSYDYPTSAIARASSGSFEIFAGYSLKLDFSEKNRNRHRSVRIM